MYLSSYRLGDWADTIVGLCRGRTRTAVYLGAGAHLGPTAQAAAYDRYAPLLTEAGLDPFHYQPPEDHDSRQRASELDGCAMVFIPGGNVFVLRDALAATGLDRTIVELVTEDRIAYGAWSAGMCVLGPSLDAFRRVDDPHAAGRAYGQRINDGLGLIGWVPVPPLAEQPSRIRSDGSSRRTART